ncbi:MAG: hypothetical protein IIY11_01455 [Clostridia bacterium]|nr:hypothetical protein [Clostridia bacterium]
MPDNINIPDNLDFSNIDDILRFVNGELERLDAEEKKQSGVNVAIDMDEINEKINDIRENGYFITGMSEAFDRRLSSFVVRCAPPELLRAYISLCGPFCLDEDLAANFLSDIYDSLYMRMIDLLEDEGIYADEEDCGYILELFAKMLCYDAPETWEDGLRAYGFSGLSDPRVAMLYNFLHGVRVSELRDIPVENNGGNKHYFLLRSDYIAEVYGDSSQRLPSVLLITLLATCQEDCDAWADKMALNTEESDAVSDAMWDAMIGHDDNDAMGFVAPLYAGDNELLTDLLAKSDYPSLFDQKLHKDIDVVIRRLAAKAEELEDFEPEDDDDDDDIFEPDPIIIPDPEEDRYTYRKPDDHEFTEIEKQMGMPEGMLKFMYDMPGEGSDKLDQLIAVHRLEKGDASGLTDDMVRMLMGPDGPNASDAEIRNARRIAEENEMNAKIFAMRLANEI